MPKQRFFPFLIIFLSCFWAQKSFAGKYDDPSSFAELYGNIQADLQAYLEAESWVPQLTNLPNGLQTAANIESHPEPGIVAAQLIAQRLAQSLAALAAQSNIGYRDADRSARSYIESRRLMSLAVVYMARYAELQGRTASFPLRGKVLNGAFWASVVPAIAATSAYIHSPLVQSLPAITLAVPFIGGLYTSYFTLWGLIDVAAFDRQWLRRIFNNRKGREVAAAFVLALEEALKPSQLSLRRLNNESDQALIRRVLEILERPQSMESDMAQVCATFLLGQEQPKLPTAGVRVADLWQQEDPVADESSGAEVLERSATKRRNQ